MTKEIFLCVAELSHIFLFIDGAIRIGQSLAKQILESKSSAKPCANFAIKLAEAGTTKIRSDFLDWLICSIPFPSVGSHIFSNTGLPDKACKVSGLINSFADLVITT